MQTSAMRKVCSGAVRCASTTSRRSRKMFCIARPQEDAFRAACAPFHPLWQPRVLSAHSAAAAPPLPTPAPAFGARQLDQSKAVKAALLAVGWAAPEGRQRGAGGRTTRCQPPSPLLLFTTPCLLTRLDLVRLFPLMRTFVIRGSSCSSCGLSSAAFPVS